MIDFQSRDPRRRVTEDTPTDDDADETDEDRTAPSPDAETRARADPETEIENETGDADSAAAGGTAPEQLADPGDGTGTTGAQPATRNKSTLAVTLLAVGEKGRW